MAFTLMNSLFAEKEKREKLIQQCEQREIEVNGEGMEMPNKSSNY